jgi:hypothetical protein
MSCSSATAAGTTTTTKTTAKTVVTTPTTKATTTTNTTVTAPATTTKTTAITTPVLIQTNFTLLITPPQTYAESTLPIFLNATDIIHLVWTVSGVGEHIRIAVNTPDGQYMGVKTGGGFIALTSDKPGDALNRSGSIVLKPSDLKWVDGYYIFHPYIAGSDPAVTVKILYWIEH